MEMKMRTGEAHEAVGLGLMSGTSLDGLDMALCKYSDFDKKFTYSIIKCSTIEYDDLLKQRLKQSDAISGQNLAQLDHDFGVLMAEKVCQFLADSELKPDFIASHGQTVFHQPGQGMTLQIGSGAALRQGRASRPSATSARSMWLWVDKGRRWCPSAIGCCSATTPPASTSADSATSPLSVETSALRSTLRHATCC